MPYQDELTALYAKAEILEQRLRERLTQDDALLTELSQLKDKVAKLEAGRLPAAKLSSLFAACVGASFLTSLVATILFMSPKTQSLPNLPRVPTLQFPAVSMPILSMPAITPLEPLQSLLSPKEMLLRWEGTLSRLKGEHEGLKEGDACTLETDASEFDYATLPLSRLRISCGGKQLYSWEEGAGTKSSEKLRQVDPTGLTGLAALRAEERGISVDHPELELDTLKKRVRLFQGNAPAWSLEISLTRATAPLRFPFPTSTDVYNPIPLSTSRDLALQVAETFGASRLNDGQRCQMKVSAATPSFYAWKFNCKAELSCGAFSLRAEETAALCYLAQDESLASIKINPEGSRKTFTFDLNTSEGSLVDSSGDTSWGATFSPAER